MIYLTADTHFGHIRMADKRGFKNTDEMDESIIYNWNKAVGKKDTVYHLGDFTFKRSVDYLNRLNGSIHLIMGNHDKLPKHMLSKFASTSQIKSIKVDYKYIVMCHYPMRSWPCSCIGALHFHGHSHGASLPTENSIDVGIDVWKQPVSLTALLSLREMRAYSDIKLKYVTVTNDEKGETLSFE
ncbi:metallophosphoesterase family protein [Candidatus Dojkabacteria bacterium]|jgi:calcineurin-like phosphoesterase family protein|nr:metallophosphoesterase family protein [Candidatus Dojkabacteria bacterium]